MLQQPIAFRRLQQPRMLLTAAAMVVVIAVTAAVVVIVDRVAQVEQAGRIVEQPDALLLFALLAHLVAQLGELGAERLH